MGGSGLKKGRKTAKNVRKYGVTLLHNAYGYAIINMYLNLYF